MFDSIRGAVCYAQARAALGEGNIPLARSKIEDAEKYLGKKLHKARLYDLNIKIAEVYLKSGEKELAVHYLDRAVMQILSYKKLSVLDREYLMDYCDLFRAEIEDEGRKIQYRLESSSYPRVSNRILEEFPISWRPRQSSGDKNYDLQ